MPEEAWLPPETTPSNEGVWLRLAEGSVLLFTVRDDIDTWVWRATPIPDYEVVGWKPIE